MKRFLIGMVVVFASGYCLSQSTAIGRNLSSSLWPRRSSRNCRPTRCIGGRVFPRLRRAQAAAGPTSLAAEVAGKVWLFTAPQGRLDARRQARSSRSAVPPVTRPVSSAITTRAERPGQDSGHTHPGSETFYVLTGRLGQKTPHGL